MASIDTLIADIYRILEDRDADEALAHKAADDLAEACKEAFLNALLEPEQKRGLRLSAIGKPDRQLWHSYHNTEQEAIRGPTYIKFLYGHIIEAMLLSLAKAAGHSVTDEQKVCEVEGVKGHMDARIDGVVMDVKSCSSYGFKKFKEGTLPFDDPFGYIGQLKAYAHSENENKIGWLAMDKQNGTLCWLGYDLDNLPSEELQEAVGYDIAERVRQVKQMVAEPLPIVCHDLQEDGNSGNLKLPTGCSYCQYKRACYPNLRTFLYGSGPRYLVHVEKEPRVLEEEEGW